MVAVGVIGDYRSSSETHRATTTSIGHAGGDDPSIAVEWIGTDCIDRANASDVLGRLDAVLIAPGSPYVSLHGALAAIEYARVHEVPLLGTCGGFQHVVLEYARHVIGYQDAQHAEYDPYASTLFITPLSCSLAGREMSVQLRPGTVASHAYGSHTATERYYCNFGLNPDHLGTIIQGGLTVSGTDHDAEPRILELPSHPFFVATLFVPQMSSSPGDPHPLIEAFVQAGRRHAQPDRR